MKNLKKSAFIAAILAFISFSLSAQDGSAFGIKGGLNYSANGDYFESIGDNAQNPDRNIGYHIGVFGKLGNKLYFRPELVYTATKSDYNSDQFDVKKIDAPLLVGLKIGIDLRYERGFNNNEARFINNNILDSSIQSRIDTRPDQLILSLSIAL